MRSLYIFHYNNYGEEIELIDLINEKKEVDEEFPITRIKVFKRDNSFYGKLKQTLELEAYKSREFIYEKIVSLDFVMKEK